MIALTQEKREELAQFAKATLNSLNGIEPENPNQYDDCLSEYTQICMEIALASLTAEEVNPADCFKPVYLCPPVPEIKLPQYQTQLNADMGQRSDWNRCIDEIKRLNGLGE